MRDVASIVGRRKVDQTQQQAYKLQDPYYNPADDKICQKYRKVCKAAAACVLAAGGSLYASGQDGTWSTQDWKNATAACTIAATGALLF